MQASYGFGYPFKAPYWLLCGILDSSQGSQDIPFELTSAQNDSECDAALKRKKYFNKRKLAKEK